MLVSHGFYKKKRVKTYILIVIWIHVNMQILMFLIPLLKVKRFFLANISLTKYIKCLVTSRDILLTLSCNEKVKWPDIRDWLIFTKSRGPAWVFSLTLIYWFMFLHNLHDVGAHTSDLVQKSFFLISSKVLPPPK